MRLHYDTRAGFREAIIALGSKRPVKEFLKLTFAGRGDIYLFDELLPDKDRTELRHHLSLHQSGAIYQRSPFKRRERIPQRAPSVAGSERPAIQDFPVARTTLSEDYFYEGHRTVRLGEVNQIVAWCPYKMVVGSTLRWSIDLMNSRDDSTIDRAIRNRVQSVTQDVYAFNFFHRGRTLAVCMTFSGGTAEVDDQKVLETDEKNLVLHRVWLHDSIQIRG